METRDKKLKELELGYANGSPEVSDETYDNLAELEGEEPTSEVEEGDVSGEKVDLPFEISSPPRVRNMKEFNAKLRLMGRLGVDSVSIEPKYDGVLLVSWVDSDDEVHHSTKGSGKIGSNLTKFITSFCHDFHADFIAKRGEYTCKLTEIVIDKEDERNFSTNARNYVTGVLSRDSVTVGDVEPLLFKHICWGFNEKDELIGLSRPKGERLNLPDIGFSDLKFMYEQTKDSSPVPLDGFVLKEDSDNKDRFELIVKFPSETAVADVTSVEWQVGSTGKITPVVYFDPVVLGYTTITCATGYSHLQFQKMGLSVGSKVVITKGGEIIPKIIEWSKPMDSGESPEWLKFSAPSHCPSCQSATRVQGAHIFCCRPYSCHDVKVKRLLRILKIIGVKGFGDSTITSLVSKNFGFPQAIKEAIGGIKSVSHETMLKILELCWDDESKSAIHSAVKIVEPKQAKSLGLSVCLTGEFGLPKAKLHDELEKLGFEIRTSVTKSTSFVCFGGGNSLERPTVKMETAKKYGLKLMGESALIQFLKDNGSKFDV